MPPLRKKLLISLHGIRTRGEWQRELCPHVSEKRWKYYPLDFGKISACRLAFGRHEKYLQRFRSEYNRIVSATPGAIPSIIVHSFGSLILTKALERFNELRFDKIVLTGSIVRRDFPWEEIRKRGQFSQVLNLVGGKDIWSRAVVKSPLAKAGNSGAEGFIKSGGDTGLEEIWYEQKQHSDALGADVYITRILPFLEDAQSSLSPNSNYLIHVDPLEAACWTVVTYLRQYVERFQNSKRENDFHYRENGYKQLESPPKGLVILVPDTPAGASVMARDAIEDTLQLTRIVFSSKARGALLGKDGYAYDLPSALESFQVYAEILDDSESSTRAMTDFKRILSDAIDRNYGALEYAPKIKTVNQVIEECNQNV